MALHPQVTAFLTRAAEAGLTPLHQLTVAEARKQFEAIAGARVGEPIAVGDIETIRIPGPVGEIPIRIYRPHATGAASGQRPATMVYFHGGGHVVGSLDSHDAVARGLCSEAGCIVASIDYRLAPEHPFPAAIDDAYAATKWVAAHSEEVGGRHGAVAVGGDSAGGNIAAAVSLVARDDRDGPAVGFQLLVYPVTDYTCSTESYRTYAQGFGGLTATGMRWFQRTYLSDIAAAEDWRASPIKAPNLSALPPALVITAECDVLHDEGAAYARAMAAAGTVVEHIDWPGMIHGFFSSAAIFDEGQKAVSLAAQRMRAALTV